MNDLQQARKLLEDKIALTKGNIERKKREFERLTKEAQETSEIIVTLNQELWKDEFALEAVNEEISRIPTLAVQKTNPLWKTFKIGLACLLLTSTSFGQAFIDFGGGAAQIIKSKEVNDCTVPMMNISAGYQFSNIVIAGVIEPSLSRVVNAPSYLGAKIGYNIRGFIPSVGALYNYRNADDVSVNRWEIGYALKYRFQLGDNGGLFAETMYASSSYSLTAGFNFQF
jgi:hypothetical protein